MRLLIRPEQMSVMQASAEEKFVRRLAAHLLARYPRAEVRLAADDPALTVKELSEERLHSLIRTGIERARSRGFSYESSISAFSAIMFEVAPNFDAHELAQPFLTDENVEPNARLDPMLEQLTEKDWGTIKSAYDVSAWQPKTEE